MWSAALAHAVQVDLLLRNHIEEVASSGGMKYPSTDKHLEVMKLLLRRGAHVDNHSEVFIMDYPVLLLVELIKLFCSGARL